MKSFSILAIAMSTLMPLGHAAGAPLVAIDAGHTLSARGAKAAGDGRDELLFNVELARDVAAKLAERRIGARMANDPPRSKESFKDRVSAGNGADFFLSIHHDSAAAKDLTQVSDANGRRWEDKAGKFKGFSIFVDPSDSLGVSCARAIGAAMIRIGESPSRYHADPSFGEARPFVDEATGVHAFPGLAVARLRKTSMALLEAGVIVNPEESARLRTPATRAAIAGAVASGLASCMPAPKPRPMK